MKIQLGWNIYLCNSTGGDGIDRGHIQLSGNRRPLEEMGTYILISDADGGVYTVEFNRDSDIAVSIYSAFNLLKTADLTGIDALFFLMVCADDIARQ